MAAVVGSIIFVVVVVGGMGSLAGAFVALAADRPAADAAADGGLVAGRLDQRAAAGSVGPENTLWPLLQHHAGAGGADPAVPAAGADPDLPAQGPARHARRADTMATAMPRDGHRFRRLERRARLASSGAGFALVLLVAPLLWRSSFAQTMLSQIGIAIIACLAYNMLLGQGGMLSFGHAVYSGPGLVHRDPRAEPRVARASCAHSGEPDAAGRRPGRPVLRRAARLRDDQEGGHHRSR